MPGAQMAVADFLTRQEQGRGSAAGRTTPQPETGGGGMWKGRSGRTGEVIKGRRESGANREMNIQSQG